MTQVFPARGLQVAVATSAAPTSYFDLQHVFVRRFSLQAQAENRRAVATDAWRVQSNVTEQFAEIEAEAALGGLPALRILRDGALQARAVMIRVIFPDESFVSGLYHVTHYEIFAEEGDVLRIAFTASSCEALLLGLGG